MGAVYTVLFIFFLAPRQVFHHCEHGHSGPETEHQETGLNAQCGLCDLVLPVPLGSPVSPELSVVIRVGTVGVELEGDLVSREAGAARGRGPPVFVFG